MKSLPFQLRIHEFLASEDKVLGEQARLLLRQVPSAVLTNYLAMLFMLFLFQQPQGNAILNGTIAVMAMNAMVPLYLHRLFRKNAASDKDVIRLAWGYTLHALFAGACWAFLFVWLFAWHPGDNDYFIMFTSACFMLGSAPVLSSFLPAYYAYVTALSVPLTILWLTTGSAAHLFFAFMEFGALLLMLLFSYWLNSTWRNSISLRFENAELVALLQQQKTAAEKANREKTRFLASASHDLRQPLHTLSLFTAVLQESAANSHISAIAEQIATSVRAMESLFNALLDISRLDAGVMRFEKSELDLQRLLTVLSNDFESQAAEKGLEFHCQFCSSRVFTDAHLLEQILRNLLSNAIRYTEAGSIRIQCEQQATTVNIQISDTGRGIPEGELESIFEEFYQLDNPERDRSKGLGLGLSIVKRTAELLNHPISVVSKPGQGSTFSILIESCDVQVPDKDAVALDFEEGASDTRIQILVIDDEATIREGTRSLLELWGCEVVTVTDKAEALDFVASSDKKPDGIIADYRLRHNQTGSEAVHAIEEMLGTKLPTLIVTGDISAERLVEIDHCDYQVLHKPVTPLKLRTFVHKIRLQC